jgi:hypothetical protein
MKRKLSIFLIICACVLSCARDGSGIQPVKPPAKSTGAAGGVWADAQGNLRIEADLFVIDRNPENPGLKKADESWNGTVTAYINPGDQDVQHSASGIISNGRFSLSFPKPETGDLQAAADQFSFFPDDWFIKGADVPIGSLFLYEDSGYHMLDLIANPEVVYIDDYYMDYEYYHLKGDRCYYFYSQGDMVISGTFGSVFGWSGREESAAIRFTPGWNVLSSSVHYDEETDAETIIGSSKNLPANAVWVLLE